jgi:BolA protein
MLRPIALGQVIPRRLFSTTATRMASASSTPMEDLMREKVCLSTLPTNLELFFSAYIFRRR